MTEPRSPVDTDTPRPLQLRRRVKRGIVASYIHELSERHNAHEPHAQDGAPEAVEPVEDA